MLLKRSPDYSPEPEKIKPEIFLDAETDDSLVMKKFSELAGGLK